MEKQTEAALNRIAAALEQIAYTMALSCEQKTDDEQAERIRQALMDSRSAWMPKRFPMHPWEIEDGCALSKERRVGV